MALSRVLILITLVFSIFKPSTQDITFLFKITTINDDKTGKRHTVNIQGNGIDTEVIADLDIGQPILIIPNGFILGDDDITYYTDTAGSLVKLPGGKPCVRKTRLGYGAEREYTLKDKECQQLKTQIVKYRNEFTSSGAVNKYNTSGVLYVIMTRETTNGVCSGSIRISGHGVDDTWSVSCYAVDLAEVLFIPQGVMVWDYKITYTNTYGQLTTIKNDSCEQKDFTEYGTITSDNLKHQMSYRNNKVQPMDCIEFRNNVLYYFDHPPKDIKIKLHHYFMEMNEKFQVFSIEGNGIEQGVIIPEEIALDMQLLYIPGGFILGDWLGNRAFVYSDSLNTLVEITPDISVEMEYSAGVLVGKLPTDRGPHLKKMVSVWEETGKKEFENGFTVHRHSYETYDEKCYMDIMMEGRGTEHRMTVSCKLGNNMETIFTEIGVIVEDYSREVDSVFIDNEGEKVVIDKHKNCKRHVYIEGSPHIDDLIGPECQRLKGRIDYAKQRLKQGYFINLAKRNKEFHIFRERYLKNEICKENIHLSGNGIAEDVKGFCLNTDNLDLLYLHEGFILGDYRHDPTCVVAHNTGNLVVIEREGRICKSYSYSNLRLVSTKPINTEDCGPIKTFVDEMWNAKQSKRYWTRKPTRGSIVDHQNKILIDIVRTDQKDVRSNDLKINGYGIEENISFDMQDDTTVVRVQGGFILGNVERNFKYIYCTEAHNLIVIQKDKGVRTCRKWMYIGGKKSVYPVENEECDSFLLATKNKWNYRNEQDDLAVKTEGITVVKRMATTNDGCEGSLTVQGDGIDQKQSVICSALKSTDVLFTPNGMVIGEPSRTPVSLFSDKPKSVVVIRDGICYKKKYIPFSSPRPFDYSSLFKAFKTNLAKSVFIWSDDSMDEKPCSKVKEIMGDYWSQHQKSNKI